MNTPMLNRLITSTAKKALAAICVVVATGGLWGCSNPNTPEAVSEQFWTAVNNRDDNTAMKLATDDSANRVTARSGEQIENLQIGEVKLLQDGEGALVATSFDTVDGDSRIHRSFDTVLKKQNGEWRVDYSSTAYSILGSSFRQLGATLSETITEASNDISEAVDDAMEEVAGEMNDALQDTVTELQQAADELREELKKQGDSGN